MEKVDATKWHETMRKELDSIEKNQVLKLVSLPKKRKHIGCKWKLKKNYKLDGTLNKYNLDSYIKTSIDFMVI